MPTETSQEIEHIRQILVQAAQKSGQESGLLGAHAGAVIRTGEPSFKASDYGCKKLSEFVERNVPELRVIGRKGIYDVIYGLRDWPDLKKLPKESDSYTSSNRHPSLWQVWTVSAGGFELAVNMVTGYVRPIKPTEPLLKNEVKVLSATQQTHRDIARKFLDKHSDIDQSLISDLTQILQDPQIGWFWKWVERMKQDPETNRTFVDYRRQELFDALESSLSNAGLPANLIPVAAKIIRDSSRKPYPFESVNQTFGHEKVSQNDKDRMPIDVRELVKFVVSEMDEHDLRLLKLPVGLVLDAVYRVSRG